MKLLSVGNNVVAVSMIHSFGYLLLLLIIALLFAEGRQQQQLQQHHTNLYKEQHQKQKQKQKHELSTTSSSFSSSSSLLLLRGGVSIRSSAVTKKIPTRPPKSNSKSTTTSTSTTISGTGTASMTVEVFNLIKNIVGVAVLSLPATIGMFSDQSTVIVPVIVYITIMGILSGYGFCTIGKVCSYVQGTSYREAWSKSIGPNTSWIPAVSSTCKTFLTCMAISMVLADTFGTLLGRTATQQRTETLLGLTISLLLPLCWMKNLASLAPFSILGVLGMAYTAIAMTIRYVDGSYSLTKLSSIESSATSTATTVSSVLLNDVPTHLRPLFGTNGWKSSYQSPKVLLLLCTLSTAFMAHFNAPKFYLELYNNTIGRYNTMVALAYGASIVLMGYITVIGFLTFGKNSASVILNNYSTKDTFISASRIAVAISLLFTYPLAFQGCRDGILDLLNVPKQSRTNNVLNITTIVLLTIITILAATVKDVGFVLAVGGATLGNALSYIYPALMYYAVVQKQGRKGEGLQLSFSIASAIVGLLMGIIGTKLAISK